jgi:hypothetical protein
MSEPREPMSGGIEDEVRQCCEDIEETHHS